jgi:hypothetical protein
MNKLNAAITQAPPPAVPGAPPAQKPKLDFAPMVEEADKSKEKMRGGLSAAMIAIIQAIYTQEAQQPGQPVNGQNVGLKPGWGGSGR